MAPPDLYPLKSLRGLVARTLFYVMAVTHFTLEALEALANLGRWGVLASLGLFAVSVVFGHLYAGGLARNAGRQLNNVLSLPTPRSESARKLQAQLR